MRRVLALANSIAANRRGGVPHRPSWCTYLVTYRCNARCGMCDSWRMKPGTEMTVLDVERVFRGVGRLDVVRVTGGEPFLRDDLLEVVEAIRRQSNPFVVHITTNGSFSEKILGFAKSFSEPKRLRFMVSFDGMASEHDRSRGSEVSFERALETVRQLSALRASGVRVSINHTVISPESMRDAAALRATLAGLGVDVQSVVAYAESSMYGLKLRGRKAEHLIVPRGYPVHPKLAGADVGGFVLRELAEAKKLRDPLLRRGKAYYLRGLLARLRSDPDPARPKCVAMRSHLRILPDGRVPVCQFNTESVGSLADRPFDAVWKSPAAEDARGWVDRCPGCWAECEVMPSAIYSGDPALLASGDRGRRKAGPNPK